ncbi:MarR family winged helix-turn-helix transcriptional regulator [Nocardioides sp. Iso805N]|uniref:MarR family winged helix-turn-helix transcriptional regulator n=1 Tax=Nocardioides sp. Iso805N TaxID=1283287 RepID=UPI000368A1F9|nr:MarR family transcriptional regulator [Nocardioides sp. Iso805N]
MTKPLKDAALAEVAADLRTTVGKMARALREHGGRLGLTPSQSEALGYLYRDGPLAVTELAQLQGVRSQSMGATVGVLESAGLVAIRPDAADGRRKVISATEQGRQLVEDARGVKEDWLAQTISTRFTPEEQIALRDSVALLLRITES